MITRNPYNVYKKQSVETVSQQQLVVMLYEGMVKFLRRAHLAAEKKDFENVHINISKTCNILIELISGINLEQGGEIAFNLKRLYVYSYEKLTIANINKDQETIQEIINIILPLTSAWKEVRDSKSVKTDPRFSQNFNRGQTIIKTA